MIHRPDTRQPYVLKRHATHLPSIRRHLVWAVMVLVLCAVFLWLYPRTYGQQEDAKAQGYTRVDPLPLPPAQDNLLSESGSEALPDLFAGDEDIFDTPENNAPGITANVSTPAPTGNPIASTTLRTAAEDRPDTILINGKPVSAGATFAGTSEQKPLTRAPISGLSRKSRFGSVPAPDKNGLTPLSAYARPFENSSDLHPVSIVIGGLGVNSALTQQAINTLPADITLAFAAHAPKLQNWINQARAAGHEVLIEVPMEARNAENTQGLERILETQDLNQNTDHLDWHLSRAQGYFGITNYAGENFLARTDAILPVIENLRTAGLGFIYDGSTTHPSLPLLAETAGLKFETAYIILDTNPEAEVINSKLERLTAQAKAGSAPIAFGFAFPETLTAVKKWTQNLESQELILAPASTKLQ